MFQYYMRLWRRSNLLFFATFFLLLILGIRKTVSITAFRYGMVALLMAYLSAWALLAPKIRYARAFLTAEERAELDARSLIYYQNALQRTTRWLFWAPFGLLLAIAEIRMRRDIVGRHWYYGVSFAWTMLFLTALWYRQYLETKISGLQENSHDSEGQNRPRHRSIPGYRPRLRP